MRSFHAAIVSLSLLLAAPAAFAQAGETPVVTAGKHDSTHVKSDPNGDVKDEVLQPP